MPELPDGTVTLLFSDVEGSTSLLQRLDQRYLAVLEEHHRLLRTAFQAHGGREVDTQGDSFFIAFARAGDAVVAALEAQRALADQAWPEGAVVRVRMGLHTGEPSQGLGGYVGLDVHRAARLSAAGHGGQVLISQTTVDLVEQELPAGLGLRDLGEHRLKDLQRPERIFQLVSADLPADFPPLKTLDVRPHNLPVQPTPLVGRAREVAAVQARLLAADARLLTLTGPGGTGKTRLALQVAAELLDQFTDGVVFVNLAPIAEAGLVASTIAQTLDLRAAGGRPLSEVMKDYLRARQVLLILDNFEQVLPAAPLIAELLGDCPRLKILVTSRAVLHLRGERDFPVPPLTLPEPGHQPTPESLSRYAAVELFIQRAREASPDFAVTNENAPALAEICVRLDGLPLAIELAAARVRLLPPRALLTRLPRRLPLLTGGARDLPARQRTLRDTIAWSYDLLAPDERALLDRLGVFVGGWTLEAAGAVAEEEAFDGLAALVDQSLVQPGELIDGEPRFTMLETVREYALERLDATGELAETRRRHATYYLAIAEQAEPGLYGQAQPEWLDRLAAELENIRAALAWYQATPGEAGQEAGLRLAAALDMFWWVRGLWAEGGSWLLQGLAATSGTPSLKRPRALNVAAILLLNQADFATASRLADEALLLARQTGDDLQAGHALITLGNVARNQSEPGRSIQLYEQALPLLERAGDPDGLARVFTTLGQALRAQGNQERAVQCQERSLTFSRTLGGPWRIAQALWTLGQIAADRGDHDRAVGYLEECVAIWRRLRAKVGLHWSVGDLGRLALARGDTERAAALCAESLVLSRDSGDRLQVARALEGLAGVAATTGWPGRAARLLGAADALRLAVRGPLWPSERASYDRHLAATRAALGAAAFAAAWAAGRVMTLEQAIASALEESGSD